MLAFCAVAQGASEGYSSATYGYEDDGKTYITTRERLLMRKVRFSYHKNNGHLRPGAAAAAMSSEKDDVRFVDVMGFNFTVKPSFYLAVQEKDGSYGKQVVSGHVFNCYPFDEAAR